jgi:DNA-binding CsgD family transcriptional regulator
VGQDAVVSESARATVVVGVDGAGRTHRLRELAAAAPGAWWFDPSAGAREQLDAALAHGHLVVVDDAHRLDGAALRALAAAARRGIPMVVSRAPTVDRPELAELDEAVAATGRVEVLEPLDLDAVAGIVARVSGRAPSGPTPAEVLAASGGLPAVATALAAGPGPGPPPALVARCQRRLAGLEPAVVAVARILALPLDLPDDIVAAAAALPRERLPAATRRLRDAGLLLPGAERMIPAVAGAILADLPPVERRQLHDAVARALVAVGADTVLAATQLRAARAWTPAAAAVYTAAGERLRFTDPAAALGWFDEAAQAGADPVQLAAGRAEAGALLGVAVDTDTHLGGGEPARQARLALVAGAVAAHRGRAARAAPALLAAGPVGPVLAVPALMATGQAEPARAAAAHRPAPAALLRLAEAALALGEPAGAVPLFIEAAEALEAAPPEVVLPDTPHALGALVAVVAGDASSAERLLVQAIDGRAGGPVFADRHRLLLGWVRMRAGRYDTAVAELRRTTPHQLPGRERLLRAALAAGIARRCGDVARLREAWTGVEPVLAGGAVDLTGLEAVEELAVAAGRLRQHHRVTAVLDSLQEAVERLGSPTAWAVALGWLRVQVAVAVDDAAGAAAVSASLAGYPATGQRQRAQQLGARCWAALLAGEVDANLVSAAAQQLADAELPWEASRLAGQAAIRTDDAVLARRLLERARDLSGADVSATDPVPDGQLGGLSEREVEVARMVLAGATYREIGGRLFISPKTVEHHVARIRTKLSATTRAELLAALREVLDTAPAS